MRSHEYWSMWIPALKTHFDVGRKHRIRSHHQYMRFDSIRYNTTQHMSCADAYSGAILLHESIDDHLQLWKNIKKLSLSWSEKKVCPAGWYTYLSPVLRVDHVGYLHWRHYVIHIWILPERKTDTKMICTMDETYTITNALFLYDGPPWVSSAWNRCDAGENRILEMSKAQSGARRNVCKFRQTPEWRLGRIHPRSC